MTFSLHPNAQRTPTLGLLLNALVFGTVVYATGCSDSEKPVASDTDDSSNSSEDRSDSDASTSTSANHSSSSNGSTNSSSQGAGTTDSDGDAGTTADADVTSADASTNDGSTPSDDSASDGGDGDNGADGGNIDAGDASDLRVATLQELTDHSATNYTDNEHGLISGARLSQWLDDWDAERPAGIDGRLVILQIEPFGVTTDVHISADEDNGVFSYIVPSSELNVQRNSGLSALETDIPDGPTTDAWLAKYAIDPRKDFILLTFEEQTATTNAVVQSVGRAWVFLKYWGVAKEHIGILDGSVNWNGANEGVALSEVANAEFSVPPDNGTVTVRDLGVDATISSISLEEIIAILKQEDGAPDLDNVRIVDARGGAEALGLLKATNTGRTDCASYTGTAPNAKCSTPFEGRIKGANSVPWTQFLDTKDNGFKFLPFDQLKERFDDQAGWDDNAEWTIQYCRTNQRSTVTGIVANVILGYPTRLYETSFIEWGHASTDPGIVPDNFPFRTDLEELTEHAELHADDLAAYTPGGTLGTLTQPVTWVAGPNYNNEDDISPVSVDPWPTNSAGWPRIDVNATTTRLAIDTDRAYLRGVSVDDLD